MSEVKTPIADAFKKWEQKATLEEKKNFCNAMNIMAETLRVAQSKETKPCSK